jgi:hypothetical protein
LLVLYARTSEHNKYIVRLANKLSGMHGLRSPCMRSAVLALRGPMLAVYPQASIRHLAGRGPDNIITLRDNTPLSFPSYYYALFLYLRLSLLGYSANIFILNLIIITN